MIVAPDTEELVRQFLLEHSAVSAVVGDRIYTNGLPPRPFWPVVVLQRLGGATRYPSWLDYPRLQFDIWANDQQTARNVASVIRAALQELPGRHDLGVVTGVDEVGGLQWLPDPHNPPGRPRYLFSVVVTVHPVS